MPDKPSPDSFPHREAHDQPDASGGASMRLSARDVETLQEIIIRAHYLAMELRDVCAVSGVGASALSVAAAHMLKNWALSFSRDLEAATRQASKP
jgi:hypothetical protein